MTRELGDFKTQLERMRTHPGFIAALDQSGGSTPNALRTYGIKDDAWSDQEQMFAIVHQMRTRIVTSPADETEAAEQSALQRSQRCNSE